MRVGGRGWGMLALAAGLAIGSAGPAWSQPASSGEAAPAAATPAAAASAPATPDSLSPRRLLDGPSLHETGRIAVAPSPMPMSAIENDAALSSPSPKEKSIARAASAIDTPPAQRP